jgi:adenylate cyclase
VITARNGDEALVSARHQAPDLILLDVMMPGKDGIQVCRELKADLSLPFMPVILVTAKAAPDDIVAGLDAGGDEYITKPVDHAALAARVRSILRIKALHDVVQEQAAQLEAWNRTLEQALGELIFRHEGTLERFVGAGLVVLFNDPLPCPDPSARALRMVLDMRARISELSERWRKQGHQLGFGVGIASDYATLGRIGFEGRFDYAAIGPVANMASRLCDEASNGEILISLRALAAVQDLVEAEPVGNSR